MKKPTFIEYLTELTVSDDPMQALKDVKQSARNPSRYQKAQMAQSVDDQRSIQQNRDDPLKSEKLRIAKMKQQLNNNEKRLSQKEKSMAQRAGVEHGEEGQM